VKAGVIDPTKGELISTMQLPNIVKTPVLVDGHNIIVKTIDNNILILSKTNGNITAKTSLVDYTLNFTSSYAPLIHGENLIEFSQSGRILIYNKNDLSPINEINISNHLKMIENEEYSLLGLVNKPVISDNKLFLNSKNSGILCIDLESKTILWHKAIPDPQKFIIRGNSIFVLTNGKQIAAINKETGDIGWVNSLFSPRKPSEAKSTTDYRYLELFEDKLVVASNDSIIYMINAISGKIETRRHLKSTTSLNKIYSGYKLEDKSSGKQNLVLFFDNGKAIRFNKPLVKK
jgi:outer membrane protein assembly factor BamB